MAVLSERAAGMISRLVTPVKAEFIVTQAMVDRAAAAAPARSAAEVRFCNCTWQAHNLLVPLARSFTRSLADYAPFYALYNG